jgi:hypothetical protein|tara:strand:- start:939 stop:1397 length:459 start_codon:yes stop_codon:yes gene_type:complete
MVYTIKAHPTTYNNTAFRSRLEARWAAFFDAAGWRWEYEPVDLNGWSPDFRLEWDCELRKCGKTHSLLAEVKPYFELDRFNGHQCMEYAYGRNGIPACSSAALGSSPRVSWFEFVHENSDSAGMYDIPSHVPDADAKWKLAGNAVQWIAEEN